MDGFYFNIAVACQTDGGFANGRTLPWPMTIRKDIEHYRHLTEHPKNEGHIMVHIHARISFEEVPEEIKASQHVRHILLSRTLRSCPKHVHSLARNFRDALKQCKEMWRSGRVDAVFIMGGEALYQEAVLHPLCDHVYLTRVFSDYVANRFFPTIENDADYKEIKVPGIESSIITDDCGLNIQFHVYQRADNKKINQGIPA